MKFKVLSGTHNENGRTYQMGEEVVTRLNLVKMFPNAFQLIEGEGELPPLEPAKQTGPDRGKDVTQDYPEAKEAGLEVFKANGFFYVYELGSNEALNTDGLKVNQVAKFLRQY